MHIRVLGSAASEGWPAIFCGCRACRRARELGGRDIRSRSSVQIDDVYKIDFTPDAFYHSISHGIDLSRLKHLFITHSHADHLALSQLEYLKRPFAQDREPLVIYASGDVIRILIDFGLQDPAYLTTLQQVRPFEQVQAGEMLVTPVLAAHKQGEECLNYVFESNGKSLLYAADTGWYPEETFEFLESQRLDCVIMEGTAGRIDHFQFHMNFDAVFRVRERLLKAGALSADSRFVMTHFSHNIDCTHSEIEDIARPHGVEVAYDGLEILI